MRLLLNACFGRAVERVLSKAGHDVVFAADRGLAGADAPQILGVACDEGRVCATLDDGFKWPEWPQELAAAFHPGIILVRITGQRMETYGEVLRRFLAATGDQDFTDTIFVVRRNGYERRTSLGREWVQVQLL